MSEEQPKPQEPYPHYGPQYQYGESKFDIWGKPIVILWLVISVVLILASIIGVIVIHADEITIEQVLIAMCGTGSVSTMAFIFYWLTYHDFKD